MTRPMPRTARSVIRKQQEVETAEENYRLLPSTE